MSIDPQIIGRIAAIIALLGTIPYLLSMFRGETKPSRAAYAIWLVIDILTVSSYFAAGARSTVWVPLAFALTTVVIFCLSFKYGMGGYKKLDLACMGIAVVAIALWITTDNPLTALYMGLLAKMLGYAPIINKSYLHPWTENSLSWGSAALASFLNLFALTSLALHFSLLPICTAAADILIALLLVLPDFRYRRLVRS